jgi:hypothetical protein
MFVYIPSLHLLSDTLHITGGVVRFLERLPSGKPYISHRLRSGHHGIFNAALCYVNSPKI